MQQNQKPRNKSIHRKAIVDKEAKNIISSAGIIVYSWKRMKLDPYLYSKKLTQNVWVKSRLETIKLLEDKDIKFLNMVLGNGFSGYNT